jgi:hypothetical protein
MASPHLLRPYTAAQLSLVSGDERVAVLAALGNRYAGPSVLVHVPTARSRLDWLSGQVEVVVFVDEPIPEPATVSRIDDMLTVFPDLGVDALTQWLPATEALKSTRNGVIQRGIDRSGVATVRCPEVIRRPILARALDEAGDDETWLNPTAAVAAIGGSVTFFEPSMLPDWLRSHE